MPFWKRKEPSDASAFTSDPARESVSSPPSPTGIGVVFVIEGMYLIGGTETGMPIVITVGHAESGVVRVGQKLRLAPGPGSKSVPKDVEAVRIEAHHKSLQSAGPGEHVGIMVRGLGKHDARKGDRLVSGSDNALQL